MMLRGRIGVLLVMGECGGEPESDFLAVASAMAEATGTLVSSRQPAGTQPCLLVSVSTMPDPVGSRWTTHQPRARDKMTKVSPLQIQVRLLIQTARWPQSRLTQQRRIRRLVRPCTDRSPRHMTLLTRRLPKARARGGMLRMYRPLP